LQVEVQKFESAGELGMPCEAEIAGLPAAAEQGNIAELKQRSSSEAHAEDAEDADTGLNAEEADMEV
jgi:hypothetical protein